MVSEWATLILWNRASKSTCLFAHLPMVHTSGSLNATPSDYIYTVSARRLRQKSCMPTFLLGITGPHLSIAGAIFLGTRAVSATLVGYNNLTQVMPSAQLDKAFVNSHDRLVWHTAHTLRALRKCMDQLGHYYKNMQADDVPSDVLHPAPHFKEFQSEQDSFQLMYRSHLLGDQLSERSVFLADAVPKSVRCEVRRAVRKGGAQDHGGGGCSCRASVLRMGRDCGSVGGGDAILRMQDNGDTDRAEHRTAPRGSSRPSQEGARARRRPGGEHSCGLKWGCAVDRF
jgi:hypothetical protein